MRIEGSALEVLRPYKERLLDPQAGFDRTASSDGMISIDAPGAYFPGASAAILSYIHGRFVLDIVKNDKQTATIDVTDSLIVK